MPAVVVGDITLLDTDGIVNAANNSLLGGGGVDGAIHHAAGPELLACTRQLGGCPTGEARITPGFRLPARWVIHTVGPVWRGGSGNEAALLANCYRHSLQLALLYQVQSIAFPAISTGVYGYPKEQAARIAVENVSSLEQDFSRVLFCCYSEEDAAIYRKLIDATRKTGIISATSPATHSE
ncbi:MAG: O-acetyl-ADP-ribose deacetylase [Chromatiales bacterium]|jgi:O-acetyl-ADP-ribose deacetylase (regulator of RNase III)